MLAKIRRMYFRDKRSIREIARRTGLSRNTVRSWLREEDAVEPKYPSRVVPSILDPYKPQLEAWLRADSRRPKRDRRTAKAMFHQLQAQGYPGGYGRVVVFVKHWREEAAQRPDRQAYVPLKFAFGEAFQFDWSCEYATIGGLRRRLEVAHTKLCASRAFLLTAYPTQGHEMLFDAHGNAFTAFGGVPRRGIYDNMKTAVDKVGKGKERSVNARFQAMCSHYLFDPDFCNRAAGWEKGVVEKNVLDRRRQLWQAVSRQSWSSLAALNAWLLRECQAAWRALRHPEWPELTVAEVLESEQAQLMPLPRLFDGYVEQPVRVSATSLVYFQRNRYSVPCEYAHQIASLRIYPASLVVVADNQVLAEYERRFDRDQTVYDWQHYIPVVARKPGALRNGAPFAEMPAPLQALQRYLLKQPGGDRVMAKVLAAVPVHGLEAVLVAVECALESGRPSGEHVLNVLARLSGAAATELADIVTAPRLTQEPKANVERYDDLLKPHTEETDHVE